MDVLLFEVHIFLFDIDETSRILNLIVVNGTPIFPLNVRVVVFVVLEILVLEALNDTFQIFVLGLLDLLVR